MSLIPLLCWLLSAKLSLQEINKTSNVSKSGCPSKCGNLTVPYPFGIGIGSNCSMNPWFDIYCDTSVEPPYMLVSTRDDYRLADISESQIRIKNPFFASRCTNDSTNFTLDFSETPYSLSDANTLTQIGCYDMGVLEGLSHQYASPNLTLNNFARGCVSFCSDGDLSRGGSCPGNGCCQIPLSKGTVFVNASISGLEDRWVSGETKPCSYSFIGEKDSFAFDAVSDLYKPPMSIVDWLQSVPVVLDWRIGTENCSQAQNSSGFGCHSNSVCIDAGDGVGGYRCSCLDGYQGNPYLPPGCQDINECEDNPCDSSALCINHSGGYKCECPKGTYGDGRTGCFPVSKGLSSVSIGLIAGMVLLTFCSVSFGLRKFVRKRNLKNRRQKFFKQNGGLLLQQQTSVQEGQTMLGNTRIFTAKELEKATDRFNESRILGRGGQGTVYKGMLSDGQIVAIKKSQLVDEHKSKYLVEQFINEVVILSQINHRNVVKLLGCCLETEVPLLVYEFVPNGTLFRHIHDDNDSHEFPFSWRMRSKIAAEVAGALAYLHSATSLPIFHRDVKSSNILLDEKYVAKVSDFGTSKSLAIGQTHLTTLVKGTFGYIDPEYFQSSQFTEKSDVYSFGVVLVELLTGLKPIIPSTSEEDAKSLVFRFLSSMDEDNLDSILDDQVATEGERGGVVVVAKLARRCLNLNGKKRPNMKEVAMELENVRMAQMGSIVDTRLHEDSKILSKDDYDYGWTSTTDFGTTTTSSCDAHPLMFDTI
ncbi:Serine/threonine protein kinase [Handroanthus impetiginosus]|uniref:Serine/threonine protein kinase n=1 Tax=Handroanthus impetiginosus TaxID=429701 RepID=A0A2G9HD60_9LAMI|nr:Serine/threonine protein kinase [Handroanthus impetiginosus]